VLKSYDNKSTNLYNIYNSLSFSDFSNLSALLFEYYLTERLIDLGNESASTWSRLLPTYVIDASIFKIWLKKPDNEFFAKFFSGQTGKTEYGYKITLGGMTIGKTFYPITFYVTPKRFTDAEVAQVILQDMDRIVKKIGIVNNLKFGRFYLSCDSGYSNADLNQYAESLNIIPICVPKKNHLIKFDDAKMNIQQFIENVFTPEEAKHKASEPDKPFYIRKRVYYNCQKRDVIILIFRLKDSNKVSVIYTTELSIKAKTLRHHWFVRTLIEQFFRFCKHTLQFAISTYSSVDDFLKKTCLFFLKALFCSVVRDKVRRKKNMKNITFGTIRALVSTRRIGEQWLQNLISLEEPF